MEDDEHTKVVSDAACNLKMCEYRSDCEDESSNDRSPVKERLVYGRRRNEPMRKCSAPSVDGLVLLKESLHRDTLLAGDNGNPHHRKALPFDGIPISPNADLTSGKSNPALHIGNLIPHHDNPIPENGNFIPVNDNAERGVSLFLRLNSLLGRGNTLLRCVGKCAVSY
ncbi:MAG: hypothetical protein ACK5MQ_16780 [Pikeienuella sp.]